MQYDAVVLGAGAAGLFCAGLLVGRGLRVLVVDHAAEAGRKILISGGGRANFTNLNTRPEHFLSENPHFAKSALARYTPEEFVALVERHGIAYHAKTPGQLFCDGSARQLVEMLLRECAGAELRLRTTLDTTAGGLERAEDGWALRLVRDGLTERVGSRAVVVATGGLSIPKLGATGLGYELARQFGLRVVPTRPALVPLVWGAEDAAWFAGLSGVATEVELGCAGGFAGSALEFRSKSGRRGEKDSGSRGEAGPGLERVSGGDAGTWREFGSELGREAEKSLGVEGGSAGGPGREAGRRAVEVRFREKLLITHRGLSGPAVLQLSSYWQPGTKIWMDLLPDREVSERVKGALLGAPKRDRAAVLGAWSSALPRRLAERLLEIAPPDGWGNDALLSAEARLHRWPVTPAGTEGYGKAEVTGGGVATSELRAQTMEAKAVPGLFFIGEVVDVTGQLGGFNFQWAWASAAAAADGIAGA